MINLKENTLAMKLYNFSHNNRGFTLIELMIVVAIIAIIATLALPSYQRYVMQAHRVDARNKLQEIAQEMQQYYSANRQYDVAAASKTWTSPTGGTTRYNISYANINATKYTLQAVPTGPQANDNCGTFTLDQSGVKTAAGQNSRGQLSIDCWRK